jgi:integrase
MASGHVRKRTSTWAYVLELPKGLDGKRRQQWVSGFKTKKAAQAALNQALADLESGGWSEASKLTVAEYLAKWLAIVAPGVKPATLHAYRRECSTLSVVFGELPLARLTTLHLREWYPKALAAGVSHGKLAYTQTILSMALKAAVQMDLVRKNVASAAPPPKRPLSDEPEPPPALAQEEVLRMLAALPEWMRILTIVTVATGLRRGEVLALRWSDVDLEHGMLRTRQNLVPLPNGGLAFSSLKTQKSRREVSLSPKLVALLREHRAAQCQVRALLGPDYQEHYDLVFPRSDGSPRNPNVVTDTWSNIRRKLDLPYTFHDLRHTQATLLMEAGVPDKVVSARLGHAKTKTTQDLYSHVRLVSQNQAAAAVETWLEGLDGAG